MRWQRKKNTESKAKEDRTGTLTPLSDKLKLMKRGFEDEGGWAGPLHVCTHVIIRC